MLRSCDFRVHNDLKTEAPANVHAVGFDLQMPRQSLHGIRAQVVSTEDPMSIFRITLVRSRPELARV